MKTSLRIARLFGIDVYVHVSWFVILLVVSVSLAVNVFPAIYPWWSTLTTYAVSAVAALLLFASVVVHELAHSVVAQSQGIRVKHITLFLLGGISALEEEPTSPGREAFMAVIGPLSSLAIAALCLAAAALTPLPEAVAAVVVYLGWMNLLLAVFNLLPGFPLDGGRVLRALLWARTHDFVKATRWAARTGHVFGYVLIAGGIVMFLSSPAAGLWTGFIGWVLTQASQASYAQSVRSRALEGVSARRIMSAPGASMPPEITLEAAAERYFSGGVGRCFPVQDGAEGFSGVVCLNDLRRSRRAAWGDDRVREVMTPWKDVVSVSPETAVTEAVRLMDENHVDRVAVMHGDRLVGFVDRTAILRHIELSSSGHSDCGRGLRTEDESGRGGDREPDQKQGDRGADAGPGSGEEANAA
jgi:Zn-dependent protease/CBS domain-containing protein